MGAGAVLDFDHNGIFPSVKNITDEVLKLNIQKVDGGERPLLRELYDYIVGKLNQVGRPEVNRYIPPQINFESLLHVVEMCISYSSCWHKELTSWPALPEFGTLIQPINFLKDIHTYDYIRGAYGLQKTVMDIVNQYDSFFREDTSTEQWYRDFWKSLSGRSNIFNLNYDNTIENSLAEYEDGFPPIKDGEEYSRFSARRYYENTSSVSTIAHLHGQILYSMAKSYPFEYTMRDMVKYRDYETACKNRGGGHFPPSNQAKEEYLQPEIVSGLRKTEKMTFAPNNVYLSDLARKVIENNRLMIIGYSFGDLYANQLLERHKLIHNKNQRVVVIDKWPDYVNDNSVSLYRYYMDYTSGGLKEFVARIIEGGIAPIDTFNHFLQIADDCWQSPNGVLRLYTKGMKYAVENHQDEILTYLRLTSS